MQQQESLYFGRNIAVFVRSTPRECTFNSTFLLDVVV
jgi:hypothetical protein